MRLNILFGWTLMFCCGTALAEAPSTQAAAAGSADTAATTADGEDQAMVELGSQMQAAYRNSLGPVYLKLRESAQPRDWMLASQLFLMAADNDPTFGNAARAELLRNAAAAAPEDALVQWTAMVAMPSVVAGGCAAPRAAPANLDTVLRLESDNGLAWLPVLDQAWRSKDALAVDSALARIAAAPRYDDHSLEYGRLLVKLFRDNADSLQQLGAALEVPMDPVQYGLALSQNAVMKPMVALNQACDRKRQPDADARRFAICADIGQRLLHDGRTTLLRHYGDQVLQAAGAPDRDEAEAQRREIAWLYDAISDGDIATSRRFAELLVRDGDELEVLRQMVRERGIPTTPPPTWQPSAREHVEIDDGEDEAAAAASED